MLTGRALGFQVVDWPGPGGCCWPHWQVKKQAEDAVEEVRAVAEGLEAQVEAATKAGP